MLNNVTLPKGWGRILIPLVHFGSSGGIQLLCHDSQTSLVPSVLNVLFKDFSSLDVYLSWGICRCLLREVTSRLMFIVYIHSFTVPFLMSFIDRYSHGLWVYPSRFHGSFGVLSSPYPSHVSHENGVIPS